MGVCVTAHHYVNKALYDCSFGPEETGEYTEDIVESGIALVCGAYCTCTGLIDNNCYFGPDARGEYILEVVGSEIVDSCDRKQCFCDTHTFYEGDTTF